MKKYKLITLLAVLVSSLAFYMCNKDKDNSIAPGYRDEKGGGGNPDPNTVIAGGTSTVTNPATSNSTLNVSGTGWSFASCASGGGTVLKAVNGSTTVQINFFTPPSNGNYNLQTGAPSSSSQAQMIIYNATSQPAGVTWYSASGLLSVSTNTATGQVTGTFNNVPCTQTQFPFPVVTASGALTCI